MDKIYALLKVLKNQTQASQREIARACGFSLGMVNTLFEKYGRTRLDLLCAERK